MCSKINGEKTLSHPWKTESIKSHIGLDVRFCHGKCFNVSNFLTLGNRIRLYSNFVMFNREKSACGSLIILLFYGIFCLQMRFVMNLNYSYMLILIVKSESLLF